MGKETIYLKIKISGEDGEIEKIRDAGLFFIQIAEALSLERENIIEIDESNFQKVCDEINKKYCK